MRGLPHQIPTVDKVRITCGLAGIQQDKRGRDNKKGLHAIMSASFRMLVKHLPIDVYL